MTNIDHYRDHAELTIQHDCAIYIVEAQGMKTGDLIRRHNNNTTTCLALLRETDTKGIFYAKVHNHPGLSLPAIYDRPQDERIKNKGQP